MAETTTTPAPTTTTPAPTTTTPAPTTTTPAPWVTPGGRSWKSHEEFLRMRLLGYV